MRLARVRIRNFRCFAGTEQRWGLDWLPSRDLNLLIGPNGCGKTSLLDAIDLALNWEGRTNRALTTEYDFRCCDTTKMIEIEVTLTDIGPALTKFDSLIQFVDKRTVTPIDDTDETPDEVKHERAVIIRFEAQRDEEDGEIRWQWVWPKFQATEFEEERRLSRSQHEAIGYFRIQPSISAGAFTLGEYSALGRHLRKLSYRLGRLPDKLKPIQVPPECVLGDLRCADCDQRVLCENSIEDTSEQIKKQSLGEMLAGIVSKARRTLGDAAWSEMQSGLGPRFGGLRSSLAAITLGLRPSEVRSDGFIPFERLSAGEKYALSFALATTRFPGTDKPIVIMEEPETALYPAAVSQILAHLHAANSPQVIATSHSESVVRRFALEHIFVMDRRRKPVRLDESIAGGGDRMSIESLIMPGRTSALFSENVIIGEGLEDAIVSRDLDRLAGKVLGEGKGFAAGNWCFFEAGGAPHAKEKADMFKKLGKRVVVLFDGDATGQEAAKDACQSFPTFMYTSSTEAAPTIESALLGGLSNKRRKSAIEAFRDYAGCHDCECKGGDISKCIENKKCSSGVEKRDRKRKLCSRCIAEYSEAGQFPPAFKTLLERLDAASSGRVITLGIENTETAGVE